MLFGEFLVLRGSQSLAIPLKLGQTLQVLPFEEGILWQCYEVSGNCWLEILFSKELEILHTSDLEKAALIQKLLFFIKREKEDLSLSGLHFKFELAFDRHFGFGTSSTLLSLLSQWSGVDAYVLSEQSFQTSGYDIAAATAVKPFVYRVKNKLENQSSLPETITNHLLFIFSGGKQSTAKRVAYFNQHTSDSSKSVEQMNQIVASAVRCTDIREWEQLMMESEQLIAPLLDMLPVKEAHFSDYPYAIKSLGAWGGDFIMAGYRNIEEAKDYFQKKQMHPVFTYPELVK